MFEKHRNNVSFRRNHELLELYTVDQGQDQDEG